ncbi:unnamed protein product [Auanema sp. JU1783]|nr:unnamed protein product [Auanema sp. JU1783]
MSFQAIVSQFFQWQTSIVVRWPLPFLIIPPIISTVLVTITAMDFHLVTTNETLQVFLPDQMQSLNDLKRLMEIFPPKDPQRDTYSMFGTNFAFAELVDDDNILSTNSILELSRLHRFVLNVKTPDGISFEDVCAKETADSACILHPFLFALEDESALFTIQFFLHYPMLTFADTTIDNAAIFGGVTTEKTTDLNSKILKAKAVRLPYMLNVGPDAVSWLQQFLSQMKSYNTSRKLYFSSSISLAKEMERNSELLFPYMPWTVVVLIVFCMIICSSSNPVRSQPWIGFFALLNATIATIASTSFLIYIGFPFLPLVFIMPFLVISIGTDNMFLMLKSWRLEQEEVDVEKRFVKALTETASSLFLTSLTDGLSFSIGSISDFFAVRIFCTYCAMAILFMFFFQVTFFNALMVLCCRREVSRRHSLLCCVKYKKMPSTNEEAFASRSLPSIPLGCLLASLAEKLIFKLFILVVYIIYLLTSIYYALGLPLGLDLKLLAPDESYVTKELRLQEEFFNDYGQYCFTTIHTENLTLWKPDVRQNLLNLYNDMSSSPYASKAEFWLEDFEEIHQGVSYTTDDFLSHLHTFLVIPKNSKYQNDIKFGSHSIVTTKFLLRVRMISSKNDWPRAKYLRKTLEESVFTGFVYDTSFLLVDQQYITVYNVVTNVVTAMISMLCICILMVPRPISALCIAISILSINIGVVGALSAVSTRLDIISMITIVMSIGFSVDYVTHTTFHYVTQREKRLEKCLVVMTDPILQSAISTIVGVSLLTLVPSYIIRTFVYTVFFVVFIGILHGLLFLPVLLSTVVPNSEYLEPYHSPKVENIIFENIYRSNNKT